ncbi:hypothetical protein [Subtercola vilae]|uniref:Uncharacterized protein n=1 Tax=Subtercola vilae TaxID=2056433 RepID=A0A4T2BYJ5_9MICO|nr:hypothetical protein [Subtercola vilae]TIH36172.1 hypothetical protein D4765_10375 [Subtercola vilae]
MTSVTPAPPDLNPSTTVQLQAMVAHIASQATRGDYPAALESLDALGVQVVADGNGATISSDRVVLVQAAVSQLRAQLATLSPSQASITPAPAPS